MDTYVHSLKYEVDHSNNQACFYVDQKKEIEVSDSTTVQRFLWQSQKWHLTMYDERLLPAVTPCGPTPDRRIVRRLKRSDEGQRYVVSEVMYTHNNDGKGDRGPHKLREFTWTPKDFGIGESYILVTFDDDEQNLSQHLISESELTKSFTSSYRASVSAVPYDDFEITYDENNEELFVEKSLRQPLGGLARLSYITEKLLHVNETTKNENCETHETKPINIKLHYQEPQIWIRPYDGNYGLEMSHFQISERFGDSIESSLLQMTKRGGMGGYLSDFSFSFSDVRRLKRFRKNDVMKKKTYADLPSDVIVIDSVKPTTRAKSPIPRESDEEDFEDLSEDFANLTANTKPTITTNIPKPRNEEVAVVVQAPKTLLSKKDDSVYKIVTTVTKEDNDRRELPMPNETDSKYQTLPALVVPSITVEGVTIQEHGDSALKNQQPGETVSPVYDSSSSDSSEDESEHEEDKQPGNISEFSTVIIKPAVVNSLPASDECDSEEEDDDERTREREIPTKSPSKPTNLEESSSDSNEKEAQQSADNDVSGGEEHPEELIQSEQLVKDNNNIQDLEDDETHQEGSLKSATDQETSLAPIKSDNEADDRASSSEEEEQNESDIFGRSEHDNDEQTTFKIALAPYSNNNEEDNITTDKFNESVVGDGRQASSVSSSDNEDEGDMTTTTTNNTYLLDNKREKSLTEDGVSYSSYDTTAIDNNNENLTDGQQTSSGSDSSENEDCGTDKQSPLEDELDTKEGRATDNYEEYSLPKVRLFLDFL